METDSDQAVSLVHVNKLEAYHESYLIKSKISSVKPQSKPWIFIIDIKKTLRSFLTLTRKNLNSQRE